MIMTRPNTRERLWTDFEDAGRRPEAPPGGRAKDALRGSRILEAQMKRDARIHRTARSKALKRTFRSGFALAVCLLVIALFFGALARMLLVVREVEFVGLSAYAEEEILASGVVPSGGFMYALDKGALQRALTLRFPYIKSVSVNRRLPSTLALTVEEEKPVYFTRVCDEYFLITNDLRAVGYSADRAELEAAGYREIQLPPIKRAVAGRPLVFEEGIGYGYVKTILEIIEASPLAGRVSEFVATDKFELTLICDGIYRICLGDTADAAVKMLVAAKILEDELFVPGIGATIDVRNPKQARVIMGST